MLIGSICGIGGGVIIKPVLDALGVVDISTASFLSGCTVLGMSCYSVANNLYDDRPDIDLKRGTALGIGAAFGGVVGKLAFNYLENLFCNSNGIGAAQSCILFFVTAVTFVYTLNKNRIRSYQVQKSAVCILIGFLLGNMSSFLGIGGGPINLVVLFYFFLCQQKLQHRIRYTSFCFHRSAACY